MNILKNLPLETKNIIYTLIQKLYLIFRPKNFQFEEIYLSYNNSFYNYSFINERTIEIPILNYYIQNINPIRVLEIGNVLNHYKNDIKRQVLDKYEIYPEVINIDIEDYFTNAKFDLIFSVSTLEHVGFDSGENHVDYLKLERCINHIIKNLLTDNGILIVSLPVNYAQHVDKFIYNSDIFQTKFFMTRDSLLLNTWKIVKYDQLEKRFRDKPLFIEEVFFGIFKKI